jgi:hypothetical protein
VHHRYPGAAIVLAELDDHLTAEPAGVPLDRPGQVADRQLEVVDSAKGGNHRRGPRDGDEFLIDDIADEQLVRGELVLVVRHARLRR